LANSSERRIGKEDWTYLTLKIFPFGLLLGITILEGKGNEGKDLLFWDLEGVPKGKGKFGQKTLEGKVWKHF